MTLRGILLITGCIILLGIVLRSMFEKRRKRPHKTPEVGDIKDILQAARNPMQPQARVNKKIAAKAAAQIEEDVLLTPKRSAVPAEPDIRVTAEELEAKTEAATEPAAVEPELGSVENVEPVEEAPVKPEQASLDLAVEERKRIANKIVVMRLIALKQDFAGYELLQALLAAGMRYGDMKIFHRHEKASGKGPILFSLASVEEPGTFDLSRIGGFSCRGLTFFMQVGEHAQPLKVFDLMLQTAHQLARELGGVLQDDHQRRLDDLRIRQIRQDISRFMQLTAEPEEAVEQ